MTLIHVADLDIHNTLRMVHYKLVYFDQMWKAEPARWIFALEGIDYEDVRVTHKEWATLKNSKYNQET